METASISPQVSTEVLSLWQNRQFDSCVEVLERVEKGNPPDPKVVHNKAIAEFCKSTWKNTDEILRLLANVKMALERNYWDGTEEAADTSAYLATAETSVVSLNMAIVHYHRNEISEALALLEPLFACIGPLDDGTAFRVCLLLLDVYIRSDDHLKAKNVLGFLEKTHGNLFNPDDRDASCEHLIDGDKGPMDINSGATGMMGDSSSSNTDESEEACMDTRLLCLPSLSKMGLVPLQLSSNNGDSRQDKERPGALDVKIHIHLYRAKLLLAMKKFRLVKRDFRSILSAAPANVTALFMKAQLLVLQGKLKKAARILSRCVEGAPEPSSIRVAALCNMGVIYHHMGKHNSAYLCFSNALKQLAELEASGMLAEAPAPNPSIIQEEQLQLLYNAGLQHLLLKRHALAIDCFRKVAVVMFNKASLWLRIAECCIGIYHDGASGKPSNSDADGHSISPMAAGVLGEKGSTQILLLPEGANSLSAANGETSILSEANSCLKNVCYLLKQQENKFLSEDPSIGEEHPLRGMNGHSGPIASNRSESRTLHYALCKMAYINLQLDQPERAYAVVEPILQDPTVDKTIALLVNCYASEALCLMDRPSDAANQLGMFMANLEDHENDLDVMASQEEGDGLEMRDILQRRDVYLSGPAAKASLYVNLGSVYATQDNLLEAQQCAKKAMAYYPNSIHAALILVYVELAQGNKDAALALMKRERRAY